MKKQVKKKKTNVGKKLVVFLALVVFLVGGYYFFLRPDNKEEEKPTESNQQEEKVPEPVEEKLTFEPTGDEKLDETLTALIDSDLKRETVKTILENTDEYPVDLLFQLSRNSDMEEFVLGYPKYKGTISAGSIDSFDKGEIPLLLQYDERWGYGFYGDEPLVLNGCGPTALAMVYAGLTGDNSITPYEIAQYSYEVGYYDLNAGTSWLLMTDGAKHYGLDGKQVLLTRTELFDGLESGKLYIASMMPGDFTLTGHFIVLTGIKDGKIVVNDPNSTKRSNELWDYDTIAPQIKGLWSYEVAH